MGTRSYLLVALTAGCAACFDFEAPDLPEAGAPAILLAGIHVSDSARLNFTGTLAPALTVDGLVRQVESDTVLVNGLRVPPRNIRRNGTRDYDFRASQPDAFDRPLSIVSPRIEGVLAAPPVVRWPTIRRVDTDSLIIAAGSDAVFRITRVGTADPAPQLTQWTLDLIGPESNFRLGGSGPPPDSVRVPAYFLPATSTGRLTAYLTYFQSGVYRRPPGDYILNLTADVRVRWDIRLTARR